MKKLATLFLIIGLVVVVSSTGAAPSWKPTKTIELIAPANPGGGWDMVCRVVQKTLIEEKLVEKNVIVVNKPGGGGATGWTYLKGKKGQGEYLAATSTLLIFNKLLGSSELTYKDLTPIAMLQAEWETVTVAADSPYKTLPELMKAIKDNPSSVPVGIGPSLGNDDHISFLQLALSYGINPKDIKFIVYPGAGGEMIPALLGGHVKAMTIGLAEVLEQHKAGKMKILGISAENRLESITDVPTYKEQGFDVVFPHWRGMIGAPGLSKEQVAYWDEVFAKMVQTKTWKDQVANLDWTTTYQNSAAHAAYLEKASNEFGSLTASVGLSK